MSGNQFRGTSLDQDPRFRDKQAALMRKTAFPPSFDTKVTAGYTRLASRRVTG